jgi:hypothetical protein
VANEDLARLRPFMDAHHYVEAFEQEGARVWLRPDRSGP